MLTKEFSSEQIKLYKFKQNFSNDGQLNKIIAQNQNLLNFINQQIWNFKTEQEIINIITVLKYIEESQCRQIRVFSIHNHTNNLLKQITIPKLHNLQFLYLSDCSILNMESISFIDAPNITLICLERNKISIASSIHKWSFSSLRLVSLSANLIQQPTNYSRVKLTLLTQNYLQSLNRQMKLKAVNFKNLPLQFRIKSIYKFNTKIALPNQYNLQQDKTLLNSLFIQNPSFFAKVEISSHLIKHVQVNQDGGNILKFDNKSRKLQQQSVTTNQTKQQITLQKEMQETKQSNINKIPSPEPEFRYLDEQEEIKMQKLLLRNHFEQIKSYYLKNQNLGFNVQPIEMNNTQLNKQKIQFKRIRQIKVMKTIFCKLKKKEN